MLVYGAIAWNEPPAIESATGVVGCGGIGSGSCSCMPASPTMQLVRRKDGMRVASETRAFRAMQRR
jgi:hypothetical protein